MRSSFVSYAAVTALWAFLATATWAQTPFLPSELPVPGNTGTLPVALVTARAPRMSPELALDTYQQRMQAQSARLAAYSDTTIMVAELTDSKQTAEYELMRRYSAPNSLEFTPLHFAGDTFVKSNVLLRLLQSEVDRVTKREGAQTALSDENYKFSLKAAEDLGGHNCYVFHVKPRHKRVGLFKGHIYIDAYTGTLRRAEGALVKSPSWWIKKVEFVQDFDDIDGFNLPTLLHSVNRVRIIGRTVVNVAHRDYHPTPISIAHTSLGGGGGGGEGSQQ